MADTSIHALRMHMTARLCIMLKAIRLKYHSDTDKGIGFNVSHFIRKFSYGYDDKYTGEILKVPGTITK